MTFSGVNWGSFEYAKYTMDWKEEGSISSNSIVFFGESPTSLNTKDWISGLMEVKKKLEQKD